MVLWGLGAKCVSGWSGVEWMDTPQTVTTTRAPAVLKTHKSEYRNWAIELKLRMRRLMFEGEGDTKYKSVCNSEDFQQRGANFLD